MARSSVDQKSVSVEMGTKTRSQQVAIYTKLESFKTAANEVRDLLKTVLKDSDVEVLLYKDYQKGSENLPLSVVVVIDARQTRTLITPERGDRNVDHVVELAKLEKETSPKGSILIVICGDEKSLNLSDGEHVANQWLQSWKYNDTKAYDLALEGRCFSINKNFNKKQEEMLRQYFHWVSVTPNVQSQQVAIYTKLDSFKPAASKVRDLLKTALRYSGIHVSLYKDCQKGSDNLPLSVVVVIDARESGTLITPKERDRKQDHIEELAKLEKQTSPKGSILIVIYGDEQSKDLSEGEHVAKQWLQSWKSKDTTAIDLATRGRCFSINENFNKKQEDMLRQYFQWVLNTSKSRVKASTIVFGDKFKEYISKAFGNNPFYRELPTDGSQNETQYGYFSFAPSGKEPILQIDFETSLLEVKVCESTNFRMALESQLKDLNTTTYGTTLSKKKRRTYGKALLSCHCSECNNILVKKRDEVKALIKKEGFDVTNDVIPVDSEDQNLLNIISVNKSWYKETPDHLQNYRKFIMCLTAVILLVTVLAISIIVSLGIVAPTPMTTLTPNTTSIANTTMTSPLTNTTQPTNFTTAENGTSISPTNSSVTYMPAPLTNFTTLVNSTGILPTNGSVTTLPSNDTTNTTM